MAAAIRHVTSRDSTVLARQVDDHDMESKTSRDSTIEELQEMARHVFIHDAFWNEMPPEFWHDNKGRLPCLYCHHKFHGPIYSYPIKLEKGNTWEVRGVFSSPFCMLKYITITRNVPPRVISLFTIMMRTVYHCDGNITPASDIEELLYNPDMAWDEWHELPRKHYQVRWTVPSEVPFRMTNLRVISHPTKGHRATGFVEQWNRAMAEPGPLPDATLTLQQAEQALEKLNAE